MFDPKHLIFTQLVTLTFSNALTPSTALPDFSDILRPFNIHEKIVNDSVILDTSYGSVKGITREIQYDIRYKKVGSMNLQTFYQVPYGDNPMRFGDPVKHEKWEGEYDATKIREVYCWGTNPYVFNFNGRGQENNCLRVSIHRPVPDADNEEDPEDFENPEKSEVTESKKQVYKKGPKALMIWIHGGSYSSGNAEGDALGINHGNGTGVGNNHFYDPAGLVTEGDVIVASVAYRLNVLGNMDTIGLPGHDSDSPQGNYNLKDITMAVDWLIENADSIGFDKERITVFGQSAGGALTSWTAALSQLQGKIKRVIPISGQMTSFLGGKLSGTNSNEVRELASHVHCMYPDSKDIVDCFNSKSYDDLSILEHLNVTWRPSRDQEWIKDDFIEDFKILSKDVDVLVGNTAGDSVLFAAFYPGSAGLYTSAGDFMYEISLNPGIEQQYLTELLVHWMRCWDLERANEDDDIVERSYTCGGVDGLQELFFTRGSSIYAQKHREGVLANNGTGKTFLYQFDVLSILTELAPEYFQSLSCDTIEGQCGAMHGEDIFYFLGKLMMRKSFLFNDLETETRIDLSSRIVQAFANFAKTGNPEVRNGIPFEEFDLEDQKRTSVREVDLSEYEVDFSKARGVPDKIVEVDGMDRVDQYASLENIVALREKSCETVEKPKKSAFEKNNFYGKAVSKVRVQESRKCGESIGTIETTTGVVNVCQNETSITAYGIKYGNFIKRFEPAEKVEVSEQMENSPACPSTTRSSSTEDCLYLVISSPSNDEVSPVLIFITDDDEFTLDHYKIEEFAQFQNKVVVIPEFRKSLLGFFSDKSLGLDNAGLYDLELALNYIFENVASFGGNVDDITIFGNGVGADYVSAITRSGKFPGLKSQILSSSTAELDLHSLEYQDRFDEYKYTSY